MITKESDLGSISHCAAELSQAVGVFSTFLTYDGFVWTEPHWKWMHMCSDNSNKNGRKSSRIGQEENVMVLGPIIRSCSQRN
jgi:hypothetical protein